MGNLVAIVGRPNVGKSTLFNRLTKTRQAIVSEEAGTTRDRQYGKCEWCGKEFSVVDTGGWVVNSDDIFEEEIRKQVIVATEEADLLLFLVDTQNGLTDWDQDVAKILRRTKLPVILVANKVDNSNQQFEKLTVKGGDRILVTDKAGHTREVLKTKTVDGKPYYNIMCREYEVKPSSGTSLTNGNYQLFTIETSSYAVVHLIDRPLSNGEMNF